MLRQGVDVAGAVIVVIILGMWLGCRVSHHTAGHPQLTYGAGHLVTTNFGQRPNREMNIFLRRS